MLPNQDLSLGLSQVCFLLPRPDGKARDVKAHDRSYIAILTQQQPTLTPEVWYLQMALTTGLIKRKQGLNTEARKVRGPGKSCSNFSVM